MEFFKKWFTRKETETKPAPSALRAQMEKYQHTINHYYHKGMTEFKTEWMGDQLTKASAELSYQSHTYKLTVTNVAFKVETKKPDGWVTLTHHMLSNDDVRWQHGETEQGRIGREFFERFPDVVHYWSSERSRKLKAYLV